MRRGSDEEPPCDDAAGHVAALPQREAVTDVNVLAEMLANQIELTTRCWSAGSNARSLLVASALNT
jgi:hypothetical protein